MKEALLEKFYAKNTEAEMMKEAVNFVYKCGVLKEFYVKAIKL